MGLQEIADVREFYAGRSRTVLEYGLVMKRQVDSAKGPGFSAKSWDTLGELVAIDEFERVGPFKDVMNWAEYLAFLTNWATSSDWECSFKRITERAGLVFLELEERSQIGQITTVVNSASVYEFNDEGMIRHIDVYLQMALPASDVLTTDEAAKDPA